MHQACFQPGRDLDKGLQIHSYLCQVSVGVCVKHEGITYMTGYDFLEASVLGMAFLMKINSIRQAGKGLSDCLS